MDRWEKTPARTAQDKIKRRTPAGSSLAGVLLFCTNLTQPTGALDSKSGKQVLELFESLNESGVTVVVITHDRKVAEQAKRIVHIIDGEITEEGQEAGNEKEKEN